MAGQVLVLVINSTFEACSYTSAICPLIAADRVYPPGGYPDPPLLCNSFIFAFPVIFVEVPVPSETDPDLENYVIQTQVGQKSESLVPELSACPHGQRPADLAVWLNLVERNGSEG